MKWLVRVGIAWLLLAIVVVAGVCALAGGIAEPVVLVNGEAIQTHGIGASSALLILAAILGAVLLCLALLSVAVPLALLLVGAVLAAVLGVVALVILSVGGVIFAPVILVGALVWWLWRRTAATPPAA